MDACCMLHAGSYGEEVDLLAPNTLVVAVAVVETERYRLRENFVTYQATYTLAGPPELRWGNLNFDAD